MKIKKGDTVMVISGKDKNRKGKIEKVLPKTGQVVVAGLNIYKKHVRAQSKDKPGGIIELSRPLNISKVMLVCPHCRQPTRVGYLRSKEGEKHRVCKKCEELI